MNITFCIRNNKLLDIFNNNNKRNTSHMYITGIYSLINIQILLTWIMYQWYIACICIPEPDWPLRFMMQGHDFHGFSTLEVDALQEWIKKYIFSSSWRL